MTAQTAQQATDQLAERNFPGIDPHNGFMALTKAKPGVYRNFFAMAQEIMRAEGTLSSAERELVGSFVSKISNCTYCYGSHVAVAEALGIADAADQIDTPSEKLRALFTLAEKLVKHERPISRADIDDVIYAGWPEAAAEEVIEVAAFFGFANRIVTGYGFVGTEQGFAMAGKFLAKSYTG